MVEFHLWVTEEINKKLKMFYFLFIFKNDGIFRTTEKMQQNFTPFSISHIEHFEFGFRSLPPFFIFFEPLGSKSQDPVNTKCAQNDFITILSLLY